MDKSTLIKSVIEKYENGVFVEIGTHYGDLSDFILANSTNTTLYCIDPYTNYDEYDDAINNITGDNIYNQAYSRLKEKYGDRVIFIRKFSADAVNDIPDNIDFLYIDGNHRYTYVLQDLEMFYHKVKQNGHIIGDDAVDYSDEMRNENGDILIHWTQDSYGHYGVIKAFNEFCQTHNLCGEVIGNQYKIDLSAIRENATFE